MPRAGPAQRFSGYYRNKSCYTLTAKQAAQAGGPAASASMLTKTQRRIFTFRLPAGAAATAGAARQHALQHSPALPTPQQYSPPLPAPQQHAHGSSRRSTVCESIFTIEHLSLNTVCYEIENHKANIFTKIDIDICQ